MSTIAIMQPYFAPYLGYFRLAARADLFVALDCVQFPRRGWVHRNRLTDRAGMSSWLTLPVARAGRETPIAAMRFAETAEERFAAACRRFPALTTGPGAAALATVGPPPAEGDLTAYLMRQLAVFQEVLGIETPVVRSSPLGLPDSLAGADRIIAICRQFGATRYLNAPGGRALYDHAHFARHGMALAFLEPYDGAPASLLERLALESPAALRGELARA